jgi:hypothetical protein
MTQAEFLNALKEENDKLSQLLADPHEGLITWWEFVRVRLNRMAELSETLEGETGDE